MTCEVCRGESGGQIAGVAAITGLPMSVCWCVSCLRNRAIPPFAADYHIESVEGHVTELAEWVFQQTVWEKDKYISFRDYAGLHPFVGGRE